MRSPAIAAAALCLLAACVSDVPNSAQGVGFGDYSDYQAQRAAREAELAGEPASLQVSQETTGTGAVAPGAPTTTAELGTVDLNNPGISDEQDFSAVSSRETIQSDADRIARQRAARAPVAVEALPDRPRNSGPNIVEYALATSNQVGQPMYDRGRTSASRYERACRRYGSPDRAQEAFLASGGPQRDREGVDPDGDGFACAWNPAPFRAARGAAAPSDAQSIASEALSAVGQ